MKRVLFAVFGTIAGLVMLLSFKTQATTVAAAPAGVATTGPDTTGSGPTGGAGSGTTTAPSAAPSGATAGATKTVTGAAANTRYGPVQVQITVTDGAVTAVKAVEYPQQDRRDAEINAFAIPQLDQEATAAKSAKIDTVSGATYTSEGYIASLQSALNQAGL